MRLGRGIKAIAINGSGLAGVSVVETVVRAIYFIAITRLIGPEGYGLWTWAIVLYGLVLSGVSLGFETQVPYAYGKGEQAGDRQAGTALVLRILITLAAMAGLGAYALLVVDGARETMAALLITPALLLRGTALMSRSIFTGRMEMPRNVPNVLAGRLFELAVGITLIAAGYGIEALVLLHGAAWGVETLLSWRVLRSRSQVRLFISDGAEAKSLLRKGVPLGVFDLANTFLAACPLVLYEPLAASLAELGQVGVAVQLSAFLLTAGLAFLSSAVPVLAQSREAGDPRVPRYGWLVAAIALVSTIALALAWQVVSEPIFALVFGHAYDLARMLTGWTILTAGAMLLPHGFQQLLILEGRFSVPLAASLAGCAAVLLCFAVWWERIGPLMALQIVLAAWLLRAAIIIAFGWKLSRQLSRELRPEQKTADS